MHSLPGAFALIEKHQADNDDDREEEQNGRENRKGFHILDCDRLSIFAPDAAQAIADFANRGKGFDAN